MLTTKQEVFDKSIGGLIKQNEFSYDGQCLYRLEKDGKILKCAAGQLLLDSHYDSIYDFQGGKISISIPNVSFDIPMDRTDLSYFLYRLQGYHDGAAKLKSRFEDFIANMKALAEKEMLDWNF